MTGFGWADAAACGAMAALLLVAWDQWRTIRRLDAAADRDAREITRLHLDQATSAFVPTTLNPRAMERFYPSEIDGPCTLTAVNECAAVFETANGGWWLLVWPDGDGPVMESPERWRVKPEFGKCFPVPAGRGRELADGIAEAHERAETMRAAARIIDPVKG